MLVRELADLLCKELDLDLKVTGFNLAEIDRGIEGLEAVTGVAATHLDQQVMIDGYIPTLTMYGRSFDSLLLVPWVGACIHTPAPPANQIIYASKPEGLEYVSLFKPMQISGRLENHPTEHYLFLFGGRRYVHASYASNYKLLNVDSFTCGLTYAIGDSDRTLHNSLHKYAMESFSNVALGEDQICNFQEGMSSSQASNLSDSGTDRLAFPDFHSATLGIYQEFETLRELLDATKSNKWSFIEQHTEDRSQRAALAQMINAQNWVAHQGVLTRRNTLRATKCDLGTLSRLMILGELRR